MTFTELEMVLALSTAVITALYLNAKTEHAHFKLQTMMLLRAVAERRAVISIKDGDLSIDPTRN